MSDVTGMPRESATMSSVTKYSSSLMPERTKARRLWSICSLSKLRSTMRSSTLMASRQSTSSPSAPSTSLREIENR